MDSISKANNSINRNKLYLPSNSLNSVPKIVIFSFLLIVFMSVLFFIHDADWSLISMAIHFLPIFISLLIYGLFLLIVLNLSKINATILSIAGNNLFLIKKTQRQQFNLNLIDHFLVITEISLAANGELHSKKLFIVDNREKMERVYTNDIANGLRKSWDKTANKLKQISGKNVIFKYFVQDLDGQLIELDEYHKEQFRKRVPLFKSPYK
jgi:hypothetical protein